MKKLLFVVLAMFTILNASLFAGEGENSKSDPQKLKIRLKFRGNLGLWDNDCKNLSFECIKLIIEINGGVVPKLTDLAPDEAIAEMLDEKTLVLNFKYPRANSDGFFYVSASTADKLNLFAKSFGYSSLKLNTGKYAVKFEGDNVTATLPVTAR
jgi:hypothetical protein